MTSQIKFISVDRMPTIKAKTEEITINLLVNITSDSVTRSFFLIVVTLSKIAKIRMNIVAKNTHNPIAKRAVNPLNPVIARLANGSCQCGMVTLSDRGQIKIPFITIR